MLDLLALGRIMRRATVAVASAAISLIAGDEATATNTAHAASEQADRFVGSYAFAGGERERAALDAAIDEVVAEMNFLVRDVARSKLRESNPIPDNVTIELDGSAEKTPRLA